MTRRGDFDYRAINAQWHEDRAALRPMASKLGRNRALRGYVQDRLAGLIATPHHVASSLATAEKYEGYAWRAEIVV